MEHLKLTLLVSSFVIPLILGVTLLAISGNDFTKRVIGFGLLNAFFVFLANYFYFYKLYHVYASVHSLHIAAVLWLFPSIYLFVKTIIDDRKSFNKELVHLVPGLVFGVTSAILFYGFLNQEERIYYLSNYRGGEAFTEFNLQLVSLFRKADVLMIVAQVVYYSVVFFRIPVVYHRQLHEEYSNIENFSINWVKWFNMSFVLIGLLSISFYMFNPFHEKNDLFLILFLFLISMFIWLIGIWSYKQMRPEVKLLIEKEVVVSNPEEILFKDELVKKLLDYFEREKPYLQPDLTLTVVCREIGTNRTYLSGMINKNFGMNFNGFVNQYRVRFLEEYLKENPQATKETLTEVGGFGSVSSFRRAFYSSNQ